MPPVTIRKLSADEKFWKVTGQPLVLVPFSVTILDNTGLSWFFATLFREVVIDANVKALGAAAFVVGVDVAAGLVSGNQLTSPHPASIKKAVDAADR